MSTACLLLHGYCGTPFEVEPIAGHLRAKGIHTVTPLLPGHGTTIEEFRKTFFPDWLACAEQEYLKLSKQYETVAVAGFSMGGALALRLAAAYSPSALVTIAAPVFTAWEALLAYRDLRLLLLPLLKYIRPTYPTKKASEQSKAIAPIKGYEGIMCLPQYHSLRNGIYATHSLLSKISCPTLILHDVRDKRSLPTSALTIAQHISSTTVELHYTKMKENVTSHHMLPTHEETRDWVAATTSTFLTNLP